MILEGSEEDVAVLIGLCRQGPGHADVERIEVLEEEPEGLTGFRTR